MALLRRIPLALLLVAALASATIAAGSEDSTITVTAADKKSDAHKKHVGHNHAQHTSPKHTTTEKTHAVSEKHSSSSSGKKIGRHHKGKAPSTAATTTKKSPTKKSSTASKHPSRASRTERHSRISKDQQQRAVVKAAVLHANLRYTIQKASPVFAAGFYKNSRFERFANNLILQGVGRYTFFLPTDRAFNKYARLTSVPGCVKMPLDEVLAEMVVPKYLDLKDLRRLTVGSKIATTSAVMLTVKQTKPMIQLGVQNGLKKLLSYSTVVKPDLGKSRRFIIHYVDNVMTSC